jgi:hypothetical protein
MNYEYTYGHKKPCKDCDHHKEEHRCQGCACDQLRKLQIQTEVDLFLNSGTVIEDVLFIFFDRKTCCAYFFDTETEPNSTIIVDCREIQAIRIENTGGCGS